MPLTIISMFLLLFSIVGGLKINKKALALSVPWVVLFIYMSLSNVGSVNNLLFYFSSAIMIFILSILSRWQESAGRLIAIMVLPHVIFTVLLFFFPGLYAIIRPLIASNNIMYEGYKTALTGHYSTNAIYISIALIIFGCIVFQSGMKDVKKKYLYFFFASVFALLLTTKRGPLIFSITAIFIAYILVDKKRFSSRFIKVITILVIAIIILYLVADFIPVLSEFITRFSEDGDSGRTVMYLLAIKMFSSNPLFGTGTGSYRLQYYVSLAKDVDHMYVNAHNVYLQLLAENGIIGLVLFLYASVTTLCKSIMLLEKFHVEKNDSERIMFISVAFQLFFLLYCLTGNPLYDSMMFMPYFIFCAVAYSFCIRRPAKIIKLERVDSSD